MRREEKVLAAFWKIYNESDKDNIDISTNDREIKIKDFYVHGGLYEESIYEKASIKICKNQNPSFFLWMKWNVEYLSVFVVDKPNEINHFARIDDKKEIKKVRDIILAIETAKDEQRKLKEEKSLNNLLK